MRKFLLIFTALLCSLLPSWAAEASYKIAFNTSKTNELNATSLMDAVTEGKDYIRSFTDLAQVYGGGTGKGIKLASSNNPGKFTLTLSPFWQKKITRVVCSKCAGMEFFRKRFLDFRRFHYRSGRNW